MDGAWHRAWRRLEVALFWEAHSTCTSPPPSMSAASFQSYILPKRDSIMMPMHSLRIENENNIDSVPASIFRCYHNGVCAALGIHGGVGTKLIGKVTLSESCQSLDLLAASASSSLDVLVFDCSTNSTTRVCLRNLNCLTPWR